MKIPEPRQVKGKKHRDPIKNTRTVAEAWIVLDNFDLFTKFDGLEDEMLKILVRLEECHA